MQAKQEGKDTTVLVSGEAFYVAQNLDAPTYDIFQKEILLKADSVILFRSSPKQKAVAVNLVKSLLKNKKLTLGIGDGFNDVNMIQTAHVGIGVQGKESNQAAAFSDYAIVKFKDLRRLMFWHGRSYTHKTMIFILMNFYKVWNRMWTIFLLNANNGMSAVTDLTGLMYALYAVCFMTFLVVWWNTDSHDVDQRIPDKKQDFKHPDLYKYCRDDIFKFYRYYILMIIFTFFPVLISTYSMFDAEENGSMNG